MTPVKHSSLYASWTGKCLLIGLNPVRKQEDEWSTGKMEDEQERNPVTMEKDALVGRKRCFLSAQCQKSPYLRVYPRHQRVQGSDQRGWEKACALLSRTIVQVTCGRVHSMAVAGWVTDPCQGRQNWQAENKRPVARLGVLQEKCCEAVLQAHHTWPRSHRSIIVL